MVIELREFNDKKKRHHGQNLNINLCYNLAKTWQFNEIFSTQITFLCCKIVESQIDLKVKTRSDFPNVWGEYENHINSYIQGTIYRTLC